MKKKKETIKVFSTNDLGLGATLSAKGFQIIKTELGKNNIVYFMFQQDEGIEECASEYYTGNLLVDAHKMVREMKTLRKVVGAHMRVLHGEKKMEEKEIEYSYEDQEKTKKKKKDKHDYILGNNGYKKI